MKVIISTSAKASEREKLLSARRVADLRKQRSDLAAAKKVVAKKTKPKRPSPARIGAKRAVVPAESKEKIQKLIAKRKELVAKHKVALAAIEKSLKALGYKPATPGRMSLTK